jgi:hypothetical protein
MSERVVYDGFMGRRLFAFALLCACHARLGDPQHHDQTTDGSMQGGDGGGSSIDAQEQLGPWGTPMKVNGASSATNNEDDPTLSSNGLELYYAVAAPAGDKNLYRMTRATRNDPFANPTALTAFNTANTDEGPRLSYDDLTIYFGQNGDIYQATRTSIDQPFGVISKVPGVDTTAYEKWLAVCGDGMHFMVSRDNGATGQDLFQGVLGQGAGTRIDELSSAASEISTFVSRDCLTAMFASNRVAGSTEIYISTRTAIDQPWGAPTVAPAPFATGIDNEDAGYTPDNHLFVFAANPDATTKDIYLSTR